ncbi:hypothetical protein A2U01_0090768, partial [Trifolium medium]|nr:hypothetical protein [Trifolium medium]
LLQYAISGAYNMQGGQMDSTYANDRGRGIS